MSSLRVGFAAVLCMLMVNAGLALGRHANTRDLRMVKGAVSGSACPDKTGFLTMTNMNWGGAKDTQLNSVGDAEKACLKDANCAAFNSLFYHTMSKPTSYFPLAGLCIYVKEPKTASSSTCKDIAGYTTLANTNWQGGTGAKLKNLDEAKKACDANASCTHFNNLGYWVAAPDGKKYIPYGGLCTYIKDSKFPL